MKNFLLIILVLAGIVMAAWLVSRHNPPPGVAEGSQPGTAASAPATTSFVPPAPSAGGAAPAAAPEPGRTLALPPVLGGPIAGSATEPLEAELKKVPRISPEDLDERMKSGAVVVIDVRDADAYTYSHITGSMHIPLSRIAGEVPYLPRDKPIVTYCT
ncbi:MAG TPA: rhodanese-like domain-containing protein [Thermoanaerobaculia bacterium]|nr:rhodanese-like domain-containing protein [Thermoanaerobaculia bacterium]